QVRLATLQRGEDPGKPDRKYERLRTELMELVNSVRLNNGRIEQLVDQLYTLNRKLISQEGRMLRFATEARVKRDDFLHQYYGHELDPKGLERVMNPPRAWRKFGEKNTDAIVRARASGAEIAEQVRLPISEYRRIVSTVQKGEKEAGRAKKEMV